MKNICFAIPPHQAFPLQGKSSYIKNLPQIFWQHLKYCHHNLFLVLMGWWGFSLLFGQIGLVSRILSCLLTNIIVIIIIIIISLICVSSSSSLMWPSIFSSFSSTTAVATSCYSIECAQRKVVIFFAGQTLCYNNWLPRCYSIASAQRKVVNYEHN